MGPGFSPRPERRQKASSSSACLRLRWRQARSTPAPEMSSSPLARPRCWVSWPKGPWLRVDVTKTSTTERALRVAIVPIEPCVDVLDKACVDECPVDCIYEGERMLYIHPDECVDCGACEPVCPVEAIFYEDDTPEQWKDFYKANVEFFDDLGSPGGASKIGKIEKDHPIVAALPPQITDE